VIVTLGNKEMRKRTSEPAIATFFLCIVLGTGFNPHTAWGLTEKSADGHAYSDINNADIVVDLTLLASIPAKRHEALHRMQATSSDSSSESITKMEKYYQTLNNILAELRAKYYAHDDFPSDISKGIDIVSQYQTSIQYPFYSSSGATAFSGTLVQNRIRMIEQLIQDIARNVCKASQEKGVVVQGDPIFYEGWKWKWDYSQ